MYAAAHSNSDAILPKSKNIGMPEPSGRSQVRTCVNLPVIQHIPNAFRHVLCSNNYMAAIRKV